MLGKQVCLHFTRAHSITALLTIEALADCRFALCHCVCRRLIDSLLCPCECRCLLCYLVALQVPARPQRLL